MDENSSIIKAVVGVAGDTRPPIYNQDAKSRVASQSFCHYGAGESCSHDKKVVVIGAGPIAAHHHLPVPPV